MCKLENNYWNIKMGDEIMNLIFFLLNFLVVIKGWIDQFLSRVKRFVKLIIRFLKIKKICNSKKIVLYGTDRYTLRYYRMLRCFNIKISYFVDNDINNNTLMNRKVVSVIDLLYEKENVYVLVTKKVNLFNVLNELESMGFSRYKDFDFIEPLIPYRDPLISDITYGYNREYPSQNDYVGFKVFGSLNDKEVYRIVTLGGSTTDPTRAGIKCWSEFLYEKLVLNGYNVVVLCGGLSGYSTTQEMLKLIRDVIPLEVNMIISFNGINDVNFVHSMGESYHPFIHTYQDKVVEYIKKISLYMNDKSNRWTYGIENHKQDYQYWLDNIKIMHSISSELNITYLCFLQPTIMNKYYKKSLQENYKVNNASGHMKNWLNRMNYFYDKALELAVDLEYIVDLSEIYREHSNVFYDECHVYENGNEIVASNIYKEIKKYI